jgi:hypothetical protein
MPKRFIIPILLICLSLNACSVLNTAIPTTTPSSGIEGTALEGPMCPGPIPVGINPCPDQPYQAMIIILNSEQIEVAKTKSDKNGFFTIPLNPGTYTIHPHSGKPFPIARDQTVEVNAGQYTQVTIQYDTGMR